MSYLFLNGNCACMRTRVHTPISLCFPFLENKSLVIHCIRQYKSGSYIYQLILTTHHVFTLLQGSVELACISLSTLARNQYICSLNTNLTLPILGWVNSICNGLILFLMILNEISPFYPPGKRWHIYIHILVYTEVFSVISPNSPLLLGTFLLSPGRYFFFNSRLKGFFFLCRFQRMHEAMLGFLLMAREGNSYQGVILFGYL